LRIHRLLIRIPSRVSLRARHIGHPVGPHSQVVALHLLADLDQAVVEELKCSRGLDPEHARQAHALFHTHLDGVHTDQPDHVLGAWRDGGGANVEGLVPVVGVLPEPHDVLLQEERVVEGDLARLLSEVVLLGLQLQVVDPLVAVADLLQQGESERAIDALVDFLLGVLADQALLLDKCVYELELSELVVAVDGVLGGRFDLDAQQFLLQTLVLLLGQVLVEITLACLGAAGECQPQLGTASIFLVDFPLAAVAGEGAFVVEAQGRAGVYVGGLHDVRVGQVDGRLQALVAGARPVAALVSLVEGERALWE